MRRLFLSITAICLGASLDTSAALACGGPKNQCLNFHVWVCGDGQNNYCGHADVCASKIVSYLAFGSQRRPYCVSFDSQGHFLNYQGFCYDPFVLSAGSWRCE